MNVIKFLFFWMLIFCFFKSNASSNSNSLKDLDRWQQELIAHSQKMRYTKRTNLDLFAVETTKFFENLHRDQLVAQQQKEFNNLTFCKKSPEKILERNLFVLAAIKFEQIQQERARRAIF
jgi:hypothetical protein